MKKYKKIFIFAALIISFYCISIIENTYAKYTTSVEGSSTLDMARWNIIVNDYDVTSNSVFTKEIEPTYTTNEYIKDGVLAPTSEGYFEIIINGSNTDVSFSYLLKITKDSQTISDLIITEVLVNDVSVTLNNDQVSGTIRYNDSDKTATVKVKFKWYEGENENMDDSADVDAVKNGLAKFNLEATFTQLN